MDLPAALRADLATLGAALAEEVDLESPLHALNADLKAAVPSYLGITMTVVTPTHEVGFTILIDAAGKPVTTSLRIPLGNDPDAKTAAKLVVYAGTPGALVDLAADMGYALALGPAALVLDGDLTAPPDTFGLTGLADHAAINQAIGVLIGRGHTPESAQHELQRLATLDHDNLRVAAEALIVSARSGSTDTA